MAGGEAADRPPFLRVVRGDASADELAALVAALMAIAGARTRATGRAGQRPAGSEWSARARFMQAPVHPAPGGWRRSALP